MSPYQSPGVYVEEVASGSAPIAGVGTSTAGFIGVINGEGTSTPAASTTVRTVAVGDAENRVAIGTGDGTTTAFPLPLPDNLGTGETIIGFVTAEDTRGFFVDGNRRTAFALTLVAGVPTLTFTATSNAAPGNGLAITGYYQLQVETPTSPSAPSPEVSAPTVAAGEVKLCTNFSEFRRFFGNFSSDPGQNTLAHAVNGFFRNGGTRCYVVWIASEADLEDALESFAAIDEIAIVAAPGFTSRTAMDSINGHCLALGDRVAIFDTPEEVNLSAANLVALLKPFNSDYAALYFPWIQVFDPATKAANPSGDGLKYVPPSGHMAGIYARVDTQRGVHKAPANEPIIGAVGLKYPISKSRQDGLNPDGINCIRELNGNIRVWGARTMDTQGEFKYINIRRLFNFLRESIDEGTQWTVFEPNAPDLWAAIRRNLTAFLTNVWRSGALFGNTAEQAFFVKCDEETNPPEVREQGQVITEIGVAIVQPAEFVIFRISQWGGPDAG
ncbi:phage tail sheath family protein [Trichothermofontia sp.]